MAREECVFALQRDWADRAFDGIAVHFDATVCPEQDQPIPVFGDIFEGVTRWRFARYLCAGMVQPCFEGGNLGRAFGLAQRQSILGRCPAGLFLDPVKGCDLFKAFFRDRGHVVMGQIKELATRMRLAIRQLNGCNVPQVKHAVVSGIAVYLQDALKALQYLRCICARSSWCIGKGDTRRLRSVLAAIIAGECPEISFLDLATSGIEDWCRCLVHEEFGRRLEMRQQRVMHWP